jgi:hypothetical protein
VYKETEALPQNTNGLHSTLWSYKIPGSSSDDFPRVAQLEFVKFTIKYSLTVIHRLKESLTQAAAAYFSVSRNLLMKPEEHAPLRRASYDDV